MSRISDYLPYPTFGGEETQVMDNHEAVATMASERYLLGELTPELRDAFEEHLFECMECAADVRAGTVFIDHAKVLLPGMLSESQPRESVDRPIKSDGKRRDWFAWMRPAMLVPVFAAMLAVIAYQNVVTYPALQTAANEPKLLPWSTLHPATRGSHQVVVADQKQGGVLLVSVPQDTTYPSYEFDLSDAQGKSVWTKTAPAGANSDGSWSLWIPGGVFKQGSYKLAILGVTSGGEKVTVQQSMFDLQIQK